MFALRFVLAPIAAASLLSASAAADPAAWDVRMTAGLAKPKARVRDGEKSLKSDSLFSGPDLDLEKSALSPGLEAGVRMGNGRLSLGGWEVSSEGSNALPSAKAFDGSVIPAGTPVSSELSWTSLRLQYLHTFPLAGRSDPGGPWLSGDAGLAVDRTTFRAELDFPGGDAKTSLRGVFPSPQVALEAKPFDRFAVRAALGGFHVGTWPNGDTDAFEPLEYRLALRGAWDRVSVEAGYYLYHLHLEQHRNKIEEDVVHMRLRTVYLGVAYSF